MNINIFCSTPQKLVFTSTELSSQTYTWYKPAEKPQDPHKTLQTPHRGSEGIWQTIKIQMREGKEQSRLKKSSRREGWIEEGGLLWRDWEGDGGQERKGWFIMDRLRERWRKEVGVWWRDWEVERWIEEGGVWWIDWRRGGGLGKKKGGVCDGETERWRVVVWWREDGVVEP